MIAAQNQPNPQLVGELLAAVLAWQEKKSAEIFSAYDRGLMTLNEWAKLRDLEYYRTSYNAGEMTVMDGKERTTRTCVCDGCHKRQERGQHKYWHAKNGWVFFCNECDSFIHEPEAIRVNVSGCESISILA